MLKMFRAVLRAILQMLEAGDVAGAIRYIKATLADK